MEHASPPPPSSEGFIYFPKLPAELRLRILEIYQEDEPGRLIEVRWSPKNERYFVDIPVPSLLHLCRDSRKIALKYFELIQIPIATTNVSRGIDFLQGSPPTFNSPGYHLPTVCLLQLYYNFDRDTFYFSLNHFAENDIFDLACSETLEHFLKALNSQRNVAKRLRAIAFNAERMNFRTLSHNMFNMGSLENIQLVFGDRCCDPESWSSAHKEAISLEQIMIPEIPTVRPPPPPNPVINIPGLGLRTIGIPISQIPGYPHFNGQADFIDTLSEEQKYAVRVGDKWQKLNDDLIRMLNFTVARTMGKTGGQAREDWGDLITIPCKIIRSAARQQRDTGSIRRNSF